MSEPTKRVIDRSKWGPGPWDGEPDRLDFRAQGFPCFALRTELGHWCGYVGVPRGHPWHGKDCGELGDVEVHGGVTYTEHCDGPICHVPAPGDPDDVWWVGFDCMHGVDCSPGVTAAVRLLPDVARSVSGTYRTLTYVKAETVRLAKQAKEAAR